MVSPHRSRFSYGRGYGPSGVFSYSPVFWGNPYRSRARGRAEGVMIGEQKGMKEALMVGYAIAGVVAVGALIWMAAKK